MKLGTPLRGLSGASDSEEMISAYAAFKKRSQRPCLIANNFFQGAKLLHFSKKLNFNSVISNDEEAENF